MGEIVFVGLGLNDEMGISLRGLQEVRTADEVFLELYTSLLPDLSMNHLQEISEKKVHLVSRKDLEELNGEAVLQAAKVGKAVLLVPGDPLVATTHVALRIEAERRRIKSRVVHGASISSAAIGLCGLHSYKFGKSVTIPFHDRAPSDTPYAVIAQNKNSDLHSLCFLDMEAEKKRYMGIDEGLRALLGVENRKKKRIVTENTLAVGLARVGSDNPKIKASPVKEILKYDFGGPPHCIVFPATLHFTEVEALIILAGAPTTVRLAAK